MTMQSDLDQIANAAESTSLTTAENFIAGSGKDGLRSYFTVQARKGQRKASLHVVIGKNPNTLKSGFATLSGELAIINSPNSPGVQERNGTAWVYLNMLPASTIADFQTVVANLVTDLTTTEGLTITSAVGATMADLQVSW